MDACCTCARVLPFASQLCQTEKPPPQDRRLTCCGRIICGDCISNNQRFAGYCPYCQVSEGPSILPQRLKEPPSYTSVPTTANTSLLSSEDTPPPYSPREQSRSPPQYEKASVPIGADDDGDDDVNDDKCETDGDGVDTKDTAPADGDALHFLDHDHDTVTSLSLRYGIPAPVLRRANRLHSDHLLAGRRTVIIPADVHLSRGSGSHVGSGSGSRSGRVVTSLSPRPVGGEEEEARKSKIRRWMVATKVADYDVAVLYLEQEAYDLDAAVATYLSDEAWERDHPFGGSGAGAGGAVAGGSASVAGPRVGFGRGKGKGFLRSSGPWASQAAYLKR